MGSGGPRGRGYGAATGRVPLCPADSLRAAAPPLPPPSSPAGARPQCAAVRAGAEGGRDRGQAGGLGWFVFSLIIVFIRASTKFCGKCASAPRAVS